MSFLDKIPVKMNDCESFGLMFMIDGGGTKWTACYYSHFVKRSIPDLRVEGKDIEDCAEKMYHLLESKRNKSLIPRALN